MLSRRFILLMSGCAVLFGCAEWRKNNYEGYTPFHEAAKAGNVTELKRLLDKGADIDQQSRSAQCTALGCAVRWRKHDAAEFLLEQGANPTISFRIASIRYTPFQMAARMGDEQMVRIFLPYVKRIDEGMGGQYQTGNRSAFTWACSLDDLSLARLLLEEGADINVRNWHYEGTPLIIAVKELQIDVARFLLENGADPELTDHQRKRSAMGWAEAMKEGKARLPTPPGRTPFPEEIEEAWRVHGEVVALLKTAQSMADKTTESE